MENEMTLAKAQAIRAEYTRLDEAFRAARKDKRVPYAKVSEYKSKRDGLEMQCNAAIKFMREHAG